MNQKQRQSIEGGWLVIQTALNRTRLDWPCYNNTRTISLHIHENTKYKQNLTAKYI